MNSKLLESDIFTGSVFIHKTGQHMCVEAIATSSKGETVFKMKLDDNSWRTYKLSGLQSLERVIRTPMRIETEIVKPKSFEAIKPKSFEAIKPKNVIEVDFQLRKRY